MYVTFGFRTGYALVFSAFQSNGNGRGIQQQSMAEVKPVGLYRATPITDIVIGDSILVYIRDSVTWANAPLRIFTEDSIYWEGDKVHWQGYWLTTTDATATEPVTFVGDPVGAGEYSSASDIDEYLSQLITGQNTVTNVYPVSVVDGGTGGVSAMAKQLRYRDEAYDIGYFRRKKMVNRNG